MLKKQLLSKVIENITHKYSNTENKFFTNCICCTSCTWPTLNNNNLAITLSGYIFSALLYVRIPTRAWVICIGVICKQVQPVQQIFFFCARPSPPPLFLTDYNNTNDNTVKKQDWRAFFQLSILFCFVF